MHDTVNLQAQAALAASEPADEGDRERADPATACTKAAFEVAVAEPQALSHCTETADAAAPAAPAALLEVAQDGDMLEVHMDRPKSPAAAMPACAALADEASKAAQPQSAPAMSADMPLKELVAAEHLALAAEKHSILWARVKGFPHWPVCFFLFSAMPATALHPDPRIIAIAVGLFRTVSTVTLTRHGE